MAFVLSVSLGPFYFVLWPTGTKVKEQNKQIRAIDRSGRSGGQAVRNSDSRSAILLSRLHVLPYLYVLIIKINNQN